MSKVPPKTISRAEFHARARAQKEEPEHVEMSERYSSRHYLEQAAQHRRMRNTGILLDLSKRRRS